MKRGLSLLSCRVFPLHVMGSKWAYSCTCRPTRIQASFLQNKIKLVGFDILVIESLEEVDVSTLSQYLSSSSSSSPIPPPPTKSVRICSY